MRLTWAEIDLANIRHNIEIIRERVSPAKMIAVVKANAYGHGIIHIAHEAVAMGVDYLGVGVLEEGLLLRRRGFKVPILVLGGVLFKQIKKFLDHNLDITASSLGLIYAINKTAAKYNRTADIHLKFDTGLNRIGMSHHKAKQVFERLKPLKNIRIVGIYSHFSTADENHPEYTQLQMDRFQEVIHIGKKMGIHPKYTHIACSGAILQHPQTFCNMIRVGLIMYGLYPNDDLRRMIHLKPVLSFKSRVVFVKEVSAGSPISYGRTHFTQRKTKIATIPVGYGDGYNRKLSNQADVLIEGRRYPVVGTVCMDQIMVDIGPDSDVKVGDEVVLYGRQNGETILVEEIAKKVGTIPYEVTCWLAQRVPRRHINGCTKK